MKRSVFVLGAVAATGWLARSWVASGVNLVRNSEITKYRALFKTKEDFGILQEFLQLGQETENIKDLKIICSLKEEKNYSAQGVKTFVDCFKIFLNYTNDYSPKQAAAILEISDRYATEALTKNLASYWQQALKDTKQQIAGFGVAAIASR